MQKKNKPRVIWNAPKPKNKCIDFSEIMAFRAATTGHNGKEDLRREEKHELKDLRKQGIDGKTKQ